MIPTTLELKSAPSLDALVPVQTQAQKERTFALQLLYLLTTLRGIVGTIALVIYFSAPCWLMLLPPPEAT
ncbi:MAG TPA: hypothetical protein VKX96_13900 [Chloroflexota bacterium]|nr:hypothetical protein [Chloroflexota bacterium]